MCNEYKLIYNQFIYHYIVLFLAIFSKERIEITLEVKCQNQLLLIIFF